MNADFFAFRAKIDCLCILFDCSETSGRRTAKRNTAVGGHPNSRHKDGLASDLVPDDHNQRLPLMAAARKLGLEPSDEGDHIHIELDRTRSAGK